MLRFIKTTVLGGIVFLLPIVIFIVIIGEALKMTRKLAEPLTAALPIDSVGGVAIGQLIALAIIVLISFLAGLAARTPTARKVVDSLEVNVLDHIPAYALMRAKASSVLTPDDTEQLRPVLIRFDDSWQLGFEVESLEGAKSFVYLPGAPDPWSGSICAVTHDRLTPVDMNIREVSDLVKRLGRGASDTLTDTLRRGDKTT